MRALRYFFDEALASLLRGYRTAAVAVVTIAAAVFVLGGFLALASNMERLFARWRDAAEFSIYLRDDAASGDRAAIENELRRSPLVRSVETVSKDEALRRFTQSFGELAAGAQDLPENPLPASIEAQLAPGVNPADVEALAGRMSAAPGVADVQYDPRWIQRLTDAARLVRLGGFALVGILIVAAALTVASVVRLALLARRDEIHIMQLVGAPIAYIRGPFVMEGLIQGGAGALLALGALWGAFLFVRSRPSDAIVGIVDLSTLVFLSAPLCGALFAGGMAVGCIGGLIAGRSTREIAD